MDIEFLADIALLVSFLECAWRRMLPDFTRNNRIVSFLIELM